MGRCNDGGPPAVVVVVVVIALLEGDKEDGVIAPAVATVDVVFIVDGLGLVGLGGTTIRLVLLVAATAVGASVAPSALLFILLEVGG